MQTLTEADEAVYQNAVKDGLKFQTAECNWDEGTQLVILPKRVQAETIVNLFAIKQAQPALKTFLIYKHYKSIDLN